MKVYERITPELQTWIEKQKIFFVGSAPLQADGHVNLSPKGHDCLRIVDDHTACYMDMTGSGNETSAHIAENGRLTFMFCAVEGPPRILRLYGRGQVVLRGTPAFDALVAQTGLSVLPSARQIVVNHVQKITTSCGYAVPKFEYLQERTTHSDFVKSKADTDPELVLYQQERNTRSLDGLVTPLGKKYGVSSSSAKKGWTPFSNSTTLATASAVLTVVCGAVVVLSMGATPSSTRVSS